MNEIKFQEKIDSERKIEPKDWMPEDYRKHLIRQISQHAHSEIIGMQPEGNWISRNTFFKIKNDFTRQSSRWLGHGLYFTQHVKL